MLKLFEEFQTNTLIVSNLGITYKGTLIDNIHLNENNQIEIWTGNPDVNNYAEEIIPDTIEDYIQIIEQIEEGLN